MCGTKQKTTTCCFVVSLVLEAVGMLMLTGGGRYDRYGKYDNVYYHNVSERAGDDYIYNYDGVADGVADNGINGFDGFDGFDSSGFGFGFDFGFGIDKLLLTPRLLLRCLDRG